MTVAVKAFTMTSKCESNRLWFVYPDLLAFVGCWQIILSSYAVRKESVVSP